MTVAAWLTEFVLTLNVAEVAPSGMVTDSAVGPPTFQSLLDIEMVTPPDGAGALRVSVPVVEPPPDTVAGFRVNDEKPMLRLKKTFWVEPAPVGCIHTIYALPRESEATTGFCELNEEFETFCGDEKVNPPSVERLQNTSTLLLLGLSCQTRWIFPLESPTLCIRRGLLVGTGACGGEKVEP